MKKIQIQNFQPLSYAGQEAINTLCTNLTFVGSEIRTLLFTSSHASEGKSFLVMNVLRTMAKYGKKVVVVDADLRRSYISSKYGFKFENREEKKGIAHYLAGMTEMDQIIYSTNIEGAYIIPIGRDVSNPIPLLHSQNFRMLIKKLREHFDYVFVDAPPVGAVIDSAEIARSCDGVLLVVDYNAVHRQELIDAKEQLEKTGCPIIGAVMNMVEMDAYLNRKYYYKKKHYNKYYTHSKGKI